jgi:hypothetical protein
MISKCEDCKYFFYMRDDYKKSLKKCLACNEVIERESIECNWYEEIIEEGDRDPNAAFVDLGENDD